MSGESGTDIRQLGPITHELAPALDLVAERAAAADAARRPDPDVIRAIADLGLLRLVVPECYGGHEAHPATFIEFTATLAQVHGSTAWVAMTCNEEAGITSAFLEPDSVSALYRDDPTVVIAGSGVPHGRATRVDGGWSVTGRWGFVSGCTAADRWVLASIVEGSDPVELCFVLVPALDELVDDTWDTIGLRGTGSHHVELTDHFVPDQWAGVVANLGLPRPDTPFYNLPSGLRFPFPKVGVATGLARRALHEFAELAGAKRPLHQRSDLRERADAQTAVARATALIGSGLAWVHERLDVLWATLVAGDPISAELHAEVRLSCSFAVQNCITAVDALVGAAGSTANFTSSPLSLLQNDIRAVAGHYMVAPYWMDTAGRVLLGLPPDHPAF
jgi:alkylation response protein AidB-like acyl-CoA dehydrogenase